MHKKTKIAEANSLISISGNAISALIVLAVAALGGIIVQAESYQAIWVLTKDPHYWPLMALIIVVGVGLGMLRDRGLRLLNEAHNIDP